MAESMACKSDCHDSQRGVSKQRQIQNHCQYLLAEAMLQNLIGLAFIQMNQSGWMPFLLTIFSSRSLDNLKLETKIILVIVNSPYLTIADCIDGTHVHNCVDNVSFHRMSEIKGHEDDI